MSAIDELSRLPPPEPPPLPAALEAELAQLAPVATRRPLRQLALLVAVSLVYSAGLLVMLTVRGDLHELPMGWLVSTCAAWLLGFVLPITLATVPRAGSMMPRWRLAGIASVVSAIAMIGLGLVLHPAGPHSFALGWDGVVRGYGCLANGLETALVPVVLGTIFLRRSLPIGSRWVAAALGAGGGSLGGLVLHLHCPVADGLHVGLVHGGVIAIAALLAAALVPRATELR
ncbi:MAG TPA: NrsF family protein [Kofleriaceae bacterium]|nr:NrsF family protein [Kofleriaceae bacterium]